METVKTIIEGHELEVPARLMPAPQIVDETEVTRVVIVGQRAYEVPLDVANALAVRDDLVKALRGLYTFNASRMDDEWLETDPHMQAARAALRKAGVN